MQDFILIRYSLKKVNMNLLNIRKEVPVFINVEVKDTTLLFMHQIIKSKLFGDKGGR